MLFLSVKSWKQKHLDFHSPQKGQEETSPLQPPKATCTAGER